MKYEKPRLIHINDLPRAEGACEDGTSNIEICVGGGNVVPGCDNGGMPTVQTGV